MSLHPGALRQLVQAVAMVAADPQTQEAYLRHVGTHPATDELALNLGQAAMLAQQFVGLGWLRPDLADRLRALDRVLADLDADAWVAGALASHPGWAEARRRARTLLFDLE